MKYIWGVFGVMFLFSCGDASEKKQKEKIIEEIMEENPADHQGQGDVNEAVVAKFEEMFGSDIPVEWELEHGKWEAEITHDDHKMEIYFTPDGNWIETSRELKTYPEDLFDPILEDFQGYEMVEVFETKTTNMEGFRIELSSEKEEVDILLSKDMEIIEIEKELKELNGENEKTTHE